MEIALSRLVKILIAALMMLAFGVQSAIASGSEVSVKISEVKAADLVSVVPSTEGNEISHIVKIADLPTAVFRTSKDVNLSETEQIELNGIRSDILDKTITAFLVGVTDLPTIVDGKSLIRATEYNQPLSFDYKMTDFLKGDDFQARKRRSVLRTRAETILKSLGNYSGQKIDQLNEYRVFAFIWENMFRSTGRAFKAYKRNQSGSKGYREFGLSFVLRGEFQIGVGKTNIMKTIARGLDIGYDLHSKELVIRRVVRHEKMDAGTAMAIGPKFEIRGYRANLEFQEHLDNKRHVHGKSWYPPAIPGVTFASETYPGYHSVGTAFALNPFDLLVPTFIFNTVNEFDADYRVRRISLSPVTYVRLTVSAAKKWLSEKTHAAGRGMRSEALNIIGVKQPASGPMANQCRAIFSRAN